MVAAPSTFYALADVADSTDVAGILVIVRRCKTNQEGEVNDVRFVKRQRRARPPEATNRYESGIG